VFRPFHPIKM